MNKSAKVSIIVPIYNVAPYLDECINSIRSQTYENIEILLIDDGSTDSSGTLCEQYAKEDARIRVFHQSNRGVVAARGLGVEHATGEYISFVDGDDKIEPNMVQVLAEQIGDADLASSGVYKYIAPKQIVNCVDSYESGVYEGEKYGDFLRSMLYDKKTYAFQRFTPWLCNKLFRRELVQAIYYKLDTNIRHTEDAVFVYMYLLKSKSVVITKELLYHYLYRESSVCHSVNESMLMDINRGYLILKDVFAEHDFGKELTYQLQKWVVKSACFAVNNHMGFDLECNIPEFIMNVADLEQKRIVLYGAGKMGRDYKKQLEQFECEVVLWVDKDFGFYQKKGFTVGAPIEIENVDYDVVLIAVSREETALEIGNNLLANGVAKDKVLWRKPMYVF